MTQPTNDWAPLEELYQELIIEASKAVHHRGDLKSDEGAKQVALQNPLCGDNIQLWVKFQSNCIGDVKFCGQGCMISQAAASLMADLVKGADLEKVKKIIANYRRLIQDRTQESDDENLGDLVALRGVRKFPARTRCALLVCEALEKLIEQH